MLGAARWGLHQRSQPGAVARGNAYEDVVVCGCGRASADLGGVSLIASKLGDRAGAADTRLARLYVGAVAGVAGAGGGAPRLVSPTKSWGVYLDNCASGYELSHSVVVGGAMVLPAVPRCAAGESPRAKEERQLVRGKGNRR